MEGHGPNRSGSGEGQVVGCCECGNEPSGLSLCLASAPYEGVRGRGWCV